MLKIERLKHLSLVLRRGWGLQKQPQTVFAPVLKNAQQRGKIAPGMFKVIISLHFSEKKSNLPPLKVGGQGGCVQSYDFKICLFKNI